MGIKKNIWVGAFTLECLFWREMGLGEMSEQVYLGAPAISCGKTIIMQKGG